MTRAEQKRLDRFVQTRRTLANLRAEAAQTIVNLDTAISFLDDEIESLKIDSSIDRVKEAADLLYDADTAQAY